MTRDEIASPTRDVEAEGSAGAPPLPADGGTKVPAIGPWQAITVLMVLLTIIVVLIVSVTTFDDASDVVAVLGVLITPIVTLGAAAFGVTVAAKSASEAGAAAGNAKARSALSKLARSEEVIRQASGEVEALEQDIDGLLGRLEQAGGSRPGRRSIDFGAGGGRDTAGAGDRLEVASEDVAAIRRRITRARAMLERP